MQSIPVDKAPGMVLCHDITRIVPGECKGPAFRKGHVITPEDVPMLLRLGKENIFVWNLAEGYVHENDAAGRLAAAVAGEGVTLGEPCEGRVNLMATRPGLLKIDRDALRALNSLDEMAVATLHGDIPVEAGQVVAGAKIIPLVVRSELLDRVEALGESRGPVVNVREFRPLTVGVVITGGEIFHGRVPDKFGPVLKAKFADLGCTLLPEVFVPDNREMTVAAIRRLIDQGAGMIAVTGGMSVDPDDLSPSSIRAAGGQVVAYGSPTFPGAMFLLAYLGDIPVVGLPGCVMYYKASIFDLVVPRLVAGERLTRADIVEFGHGGLCSQCPECRYPQCGFGKR